jgi:nitroimidazol reductase NimA-like FMN-containing flavoprotein (pyridoxamine 5'-phosphate oxidase superfamily)
MLSWAHVVERMTNATHYWVTTVAPGNHPHATPVDGLWLDDAFYFGGSSATRRSRNLAANRAVCVHLESATDVVIVHGEAEEIRSPDPALVERLAKESARKYGYGAKPEDFARGGTYMVRPRLVFAWKQFPKDATRWQLSGEPD